MTERVVLDAVREVVTQPDNVEVDALRCEIEQIERHRSIAFEPPPRPWIDERLVRIHEILERRTERSALLLRKFLTPMRLSPVWVDVGRPYYQVTSAIDTLALFEPCPELENSDSGSNSLREWS